MDWKPVVGSQDILELVVAKKLVARERVVWTSTDESLVSTKGRITYDWAHRTVDYLKQG